MAETVNPTEGITCSEVRSLMAAKISPGGFVVATVTNPGSFMATITHPTGNGYCRDRILRDRPDYQTISCERLRASLSRSTNISSYCCTEFQSYG